MIDRAVVAGATFYDIQSGNNRSAYAYLEKRRRLSKRIVESRVVELVIAISSMSRRRNKLAEQDSSKILA